MPTPILIAALDPCWRDDINYDVGNLKAYDGKIYRCLKPSGPNTNGGVQVPDKSPEYWAVFQTVYSGYEPGSGIHIDGDKISVDSSVARISGLSDE